MANLGNAWHIPNNPEPRGLAGMRSPIGAIVQGTAVTICSGNQFQGFGGNPGNQLQVGSAVFFKRASAAVWSSIPMLFRNANGNNKYYTAKLPPGAFGTGDMVQYYLRIPYDDHDTTFVHKAGGASATTASEATAQAAPFTFTVEDRAKLGQWGPVFALPNVAIHASVLPNGRVLMWGRRDEPTDSLDVHECTPFVWDPADGSVAHTEQPKRADGTKVNLFCSGHAFLPDGRLLVVGGHLADGDGLSQATLYDYTTGRWTPTVPMTTPAGEEVRRWYPTATTLPNGTVLVVSGSYIDPQQPPGKQTIVADLLQIWDDGIWRTIAKQDGTPLNFIGLPLYPRMHVASDGRVFMSGTNDRTLLLKTSAPGAWSQVAFRALGNRDYCPVVLYDVDRLIYIGGGNDAGTQTPAAGAETIDLGATPRQWQNAGAMHYPRRQHNATALPDGTVLVTGGTRGGGGPNHGFNDLNAGMPVHVAELWDPSSRRWTELVAEDVARCYHATAVLLPDASVLSAGGGEYRPDNVNANAAEDSHRDAQRFLPPYLFKGSRPVIASAPAAIDYGAQFDVATPQAADIRKVSLIRLPSVTHSFDENQRIQFLAFAPQAAGVKVTAPASPNESPPGHYMLFLVNRAGVPSLAAMVQIRPLPRPAAPFRGEAAPAEAMRAEAAYASGEARPRSYLQVYARAAQVDRGARGTAVLVGITGTCPYGIGACWGGAYEALGRLDAVDLVGPIPNADDSTADVYLRDQRLPPLDVWHEQFRRIVNGTYELRGVEVTLEGALELCGDDLYLVKTELRPAIRLAVLEWAGKIQWDHAARAPRPVDLNEAGAHARLLAEWHGDPSARRHGRRIVTGPIELSEGVYTLHVRQFSSA